MSIDVFILAAGEPARGTVPSPLKNVNFAETVLDWQLKSLTEAGFNGQRFLIGGYNAQDIIERRPDLSLVVAPNWSVQAPADTLALAPLTDRGGLIFYSDTLFRPKHLNALRLSDADLTVAVDSRWRTRFSSRTAEDIWHAETLHTDEFGECEFTGLLKFGAKAFSWFQSNRDDFVNASMVEVIRQAVHNIKSVKIIDIEGDWAELNSDSDIARFILGKKSETLSRLRGNLDCSKILEGLNISHQDWVESKDDVVTSIKTNFRGKHIIVRSNSSHEDNWSGSNAGRFDSKTNIDVADSEKLKNSIDEVFLSYGAVTDDETVFIQTFVQEFDIAGVIFTCALDTGAPYYQVNFSGDDVDIDAVTSGGSSATRTIFVSKYNFKACSMLSAAMKAALQAAAEIEKALRYNRLDIEFAVLSNGDVVIFQVRPITVDYSDFELDHADFEQQIQSHAHRFQSLQRAKPGIVGSRSFLADMPDWNPAEIIGIRPKPLAVSLYEKLITNRVWAQQRAEFGYRDTRPSPLMFLVLGHPFIDVRASLNSFIPATMPDDQAERIVNAYLNFLEDHPSKHDKLEFEVSFTAWTADLNRKILHRLRPYGIDEMCANSLENGLREITKRALQTDSTFAAEDDLSNLKSVIAQNDLMRSLAAANALIEEVASSDTLKFAHAARLGFVANTILRHLRDNCSITPQRYDQFFSSLETVTTIFTKKMRLLKAGSISLHDIVEQFGHLRPGTYEISETAYWEAPEKYFNTSRISDAASMENFVPNDLELEGARQFLLALGSDMQPAEFFKRLGNFIRARELSKFEFTKKLSLALDLYVHFGGRAGIARPDLSYVRWENFKQLEIGTKEVAQLKQLIQIEKRQYRAHSASQLPSILFSSECLTCFERKPGEPNFITNKKVNAPILEIAGQNESALKLENSVVLIDRADPGYDWLFNENIAGLITKYGGANSHMAIRSAEMGIPAAIGVGEALYDSMRQLDSVLLDCENRQLGEPK